VLAAAGIAFTILAPHQVECAPLFGHPGVVRTSATRRIAVFLYDGPLSHGVAFGALIKHPTAWYQRLHLPPDDVRTAKLVSLATDGETYGHHHAKGIEALARVLERLAAAGVVLDNYAAFLARNPPRQFARLVENSSWSCAHGVERWRADCGCRLKEKTLQGWRTPLRAGLDELRGEIDRLLFARSLATPDDPGVCRSSLPLDWHARRMFSSCGWFFDDVAGIESRISIAHALRACELAGPDRQRLLAALRERLATAPSGDATVATGAGVIDDILATARPDARG